MYICIQNPVLLGNYQLVFYLFLPVNTHTTVSNTPNMYFDYSKANWIGMNSFLTNYDFTCTPIYGSNDIEFIWFYLKQTVYLVLELHVPRVVANHQHPVWFNGKIRHELNCLYILRMKCRSNPTLNNKSELWMAKNN